MDEFTVQFKFALNKPVRISALGLEGHVISRSDRGMYRVYNVIWWAEQRRNDEWLHESELEAVKV